jgi:hypothetical protein
LRVTLSIVKFYHAEWFFEEVVVLE